MRRSRFLILMVAVVITAVVFGACSSKSEQNDSSPSRTPIPTSTGSSDTPRPADSDNSQDSPTTTANEPSNNGIAVGEPALGLSPVSLPTRRLTFHVTVPANTPANEPVYLATMDVAFGFTERIEMKHLGGLEYEVQAEVLDGAMIRYAYDRFDEEDGCCEFENTRESLGDSFRLQYRFLLTTAGLDRVNDSIPEWADLRIPYEEGEITGTVVESENGESVLDADISISGVHVGTRADGSFKVPRLPAGEHAVVVYSNTGDFEAVQKIVTLSAGGTTNVDFSVTNVELVPVTFDVRLPKSTPNDAWVKMAGNIHALGGRIGHPSRPMSPDNYFIPMLERDGDQASADFMLPAGSIVEYFYVLGPVGSTDETLEHGRRVRRSFIVGEDGSRRSDNVEGWANEGWPLITLRLIPPIGTPPNTPIALNMGPSSWMEPAGDGTYTTVLGSYPPGGVITYRYILGGDANGSDDSPEASDGMRSITVPKNNTEVVDIVTRWVGQRDSSTRRADGSLAVKFRVSVPPETPVDAKIFLLGDRPAVTDGASSNGREMTQVAGNPWMYETEVVFGHDGRLVYSFELRSEGGLETFAREIFTNFDGQVVNDWVIQWPGLSSSVDER